MAGVPTYESHNGRLMETGGGCSLLDVIIRDGKRRSVFRSYVYPYMNRPNLTVLTGALVTRLFFEGKQAREVEFVRKGKPLRVGAAKEIVLSLGAIHTPKVLMLSGIGHERELQSFGIPVLQHLPGVGQNLQDHPSVGCLFEPQTPLVAHNNGAEAVLFWRSDPALTAPDLFGCGLEYSFGGPPLLQRFGAPPTCWSFLGGVYRPESRGFVRLSGSHPNNPVRVQANHFQQESDMRVALAALHLGREIGHSAAMRPFVKREIAPGPLGVTELENYIRDTAGSWSHETGTAKMGRDALSVVDRQLRVYGIDKLRIADGSIMPRVTTGNTMAPCVVIGERASDLLKAQHGV